MVLILCCRDRKLRDGVLQFMILLDVGLLVVFDYGIFSGLPRDPELNGSLLRFKVLLEIDMRGF